MEEKTIVGIASAAGGGIGIIRVSGSESMKIVDSIFHPGEALTGTDKGGKGRLPLLNCFCDSDEWHSLCAAKRGGATGI